MKLNKLPQQIWFKSIALLLCVVLPLTEITPAFADRDSEIPLRAGFGSPTDDDALRRTKDMTFRLNELFIRERILSRLTPDEIKQLQETGFGVAHEKVTDKTKSRRKRQDAGDEVRTDAPSTIIDRWSAWLKTKGRILGILRFSLFYIAPPLVLLRLPNDLAMLAWDSLFTFVNIFFSMQVYTGIIERISFFDTSAWPQHESVLRRIFRGAVFVIGNILILNVSLVLGISFVTFAYHFSSLVVPPEYQKHIALTVPSLFLAWLISKLQKSIQQKSARGNIRRAFSQLKNSSWAVHIQETVKRASGILILGATVLSHEFFFRYFYVPLFYGIMSWSVTLENGKTVRIHGISEREVSRAEMVYDLNALPDRVYDEKHPHRVNFYGYPPEIWYYGGFYSHSESWSRFLPSNIFTKIFVSTRANADFRVLALWHEHGHHVYRADWFRDRMKRWNELYEKYRQNPKGFVLTNYSLKNADEGFADWFAYFTRDNGQRVIEYMEKGDDVQKEMWMIIASVFVEEMHGRPFLQVNFPEIQKTVGVQVRLDGKGNLAAGEFEQAVRLAQHSALSRIVLSWSFPLDKQAIQTIHYIPTGEEPALENNLKLLSRIATRNDILSGLIINASPDEIVEMLNEIVLRPGQNVFLHEMAVLFLSKIGDESSAPALLYHLKERSAQETREPVYKALKQMKSPEAKQAISDSLEQVVQARQAVWNNPYELERLDFLVMAHVILGGQHSIFDRAYLEEIFTRRGGFDQIDATYGKFWGDELYRYLREIDKHDGEFPPDQRPTSGRTTFGFGSVGEYKGYEEIFVKLRDDFLRTSDGGNPVLFVDGMPGAGKSMFAKLFKDFLEQSGHQAEIIKSDWFIKMRMSNVVAWLILHIPFLSVRWKQTLIQNWKYNLNAINSLVKKINEAIALFNTGRETTTRFVVEARLSRGEFKASDSSNRIVPRAIELHKGGFIILEGALSSVFFQGIPNGKRIRLEATLQKTRERYMARTLEKDDMGAIFSRLISRVASSPSLDSVLRENTYDDDYVIDVNNFENPVMRAGKRWVAIQLAGGDGGRMRKHDGEEPKQIRPVAGKPLMQHFLDLAAEKGLPAFSAIKSDATLIRERIRSGSTRFIETGKGTLDAMLAAYDVLKREKFSGNVLVVPGDIIVTEPDFIDAMMATHAPKSGKSALYTFTTTFAAHSHSIDRIVRRRNGKFETLVSQKEIDLLREEGGTLKLSDGSVLTADDLENIQEVWGSVSAFHYGVYRLFGSLWHHDLDYAKEISRYALFASAPVYWLLKKIWDKVYATVRAKVGTDSFSSRTHYLKTQKFNRRKILNRGKIWRAFLNSGLVRMYQAEKPDSILDLNTPEQLAHAEEILTTKPSHTEGAASIRAGPGIADEPALKSWPATDAERAFEKYIKSTPHLGHFFLSEFFKRLSTNEQQTVLKEFDYYRGPAKKFDWNFIEEMAEKYLKETGRAELWVEYEEAFEQTYVSLPDFFKLIGRDDLIDRFQEWLAAQPYRRFLEIAGIGKAGQFISVRQGLVPEGFREAFEIFQDRGAPADVNEVVSAVEEHFGKFLPDLFSPLESHEPETPYLKRLNVGTVADTFLARLIDGRNVVLKVVTPAKKLRLIQGLDRMGEVAAELERRRLEFSGEEAIQISPVRFFQEFKKSVLRELDMNTEARQARRIIRHYPVGFSRPKIFESSEHVLMMSFVPGAKVTSVSDSASRKKIAKKILPLIALQAMADSVFHSDPHPANIFYDGATDQIALFDFGQTGELSDALRKDLVRMAVRIVESGNRQGKWGKILIGLVGWLLTNRMFAKVVRAALFQYFAWEENINAIRQFLRGTKKGKIEPDSLPVAHIYPKKKEKQTIEYEHSVLDDELIALFNAKRTDAIVELLLREGKKLEGFNQTAFREAVLGLVQKSLAKWKYEQPYLAADKIMYTAEEAGLILSSPYSGIIEDIFSFVQKYALTEEASNVDPIGMKAEIASILRFRREGESMIPKIHRILLASERFGYPVISSAGMLIKSLLLAEGVQKILSTNVDESAGELDLNDAGFGAAEPTILQIIGLVAMSIPFSAIVLTVTPLGRLLYAFLLKSKRVRRAIRWFRLRQMLKPEKIDRQYVSPSTSHLAGQPENADPLRVDAGELESMLLHNQVNAQFVFKYFIPKITAAVSTVREAHEAIRTLYQECRDPAVFKRIMTSFFSLFFTERGFDLHLTIFEMVIEALKRESGSLREFMNTGVKTLDQFFAAVYEAADDRIIRSKEIDWELLIQEAYRAVSRGEKFHIDVSPKAIRSQIRSLKIIKDGTTGFESQAELTPLTFVQNQNKGDADHPRIVSPPFDVFLVEDPKTNRLILKSQYVHSPESFLLENDFETLQAIHEGEERDDIQKPLTPIIRWRTDGPRGSAKAFHQDKQGTRIGFVANFFPGSDGSEVLLPILDKYRSSQPELIWQLMLKSAQTLAYVHQKGFVHRDIKPSNYIVQVTSKDVSLGLIDFAIAARMGQPISNEKISNSFTLQYSEQAYVEGVEQWANVTDAKYDIFSWGATVYFWLTGQEPMPSEFVYRPAEALVKLWKLRLNNSPYAAIVLKAMELDRDKRYSSMEKIIYDLIEVGKELGFTSEVGFGVSAGEAERLAKIFHTQLKALETVEKSFKTPDVSALAKMFRAVEKYEFSKFISEVYSAMESADIQRFSGDIRGYVQDYYNFLVIVSRFPEDAQRFFDLAGGADVLLKAAGFSLIDKSSRLLIKEWVDLIVLREELDQFLEFLGIKDAKDFARIIKKYGAGKTFKSLRPFIDFPYPNKDRFRAALDLLASLDPERTGILSILFRLNPEVFQDLFSELVTTDLAKGPYKSIPQSEIRLSHVIDRALAKMPGLPPEWFKAYMKIAYDRSEYKPASARLQASYRPAENRQFTENLENYAQLYDELVLGKNDEEIPLLNKALALQAEEIPQNSNLAKFRDLYAHSRYEVILRILIEQFGDAAKVAETLSRIRNIPRGHLGEPILPAATDIFKAADEYADTLSATISPETRAAIKFVRGDYLKEIAFLKQAVELAPNKAEYWFKYGAMLRAKEKTDDAEAALSKAVEINPNHLDARLALGDTFGDGADVYFEARAYDEAQARWRKAIEAYEFVFEKTTEDKTKALVNRRLRDAYMGLYRAFTSGRKDPFSGIIKVPDRVEIILALEKFLMEVLAHHPDFINIANALLYLYRDALNLPKENNREYFKEKLLALFSLFEQDSEKDLESVFRALVDVYETDGEFAEAIRWQERLVGYVTSKYPEGSDRIVGAQAELENLRSISADRGFGAGEDQKPHALEAMFEKTKTGQAEYGVWSDDKELGPIVEFDQYNQERIFVPEPLRGLLEKEIMWDFIRTPSADLTQITRRQDLLQALMNSGALGKITKLKNETYSINRGIAQIYSLVKVSEYREEPAIYLYRKGEGGGDLVHSGLRQLGRGKQALAQLIETLQQIKEPIISEVVESLKKDFERASILNDDYFLKGDKYRTGNPQGLSASVDHHLMLLGAMIEFANIAARDNYARANFNNDTPEGYKQGWNFVREKALQTLNDSPGAEALAVLSGTNMGGKSFHLMQNFYMQLLAQTFGYVPAAQGNFRIYDSILYLDRASTKSHHDLSAYGAEIEQWKAALAKMGKKTFLLVDEGFSTTSAEDQYAMLMGVTEYLAKRGGRTILTTHNEVFIEQSAKNPRIGIYHFPLQQGADGKIIFDKDKQPTYTHKLTPGPGDSHALEIAEALGLPPELLALAKEFLAGVRNRVEPPAGRTWRKIESYSEAERGELKHKAASISSVFRPTEDGKKKTLQLLSADSDFQHRFYFGGSNIVTGEDGEGFKFGDLTFDSPAMRSSALLELLTGGAKLDSKEILERQQMFAALSKGDRYEELKDIGNRLMWITQFLPWVGSVLGNNGLLRFNTAFYNEPHAISGDARGLEYAYMFFRMNQKIFGEQFPKPLSEWLEKIEKARKLLAISEEYQMGQDIVEIENAQRVDIDEEITDEKTIADFAASAKDEPHPEKWQGKLTRRRIKEYLRWVKDKKPEKFSAIKNHHHSVDTLVALIWNVMQGYGDVGFFDSVHADVFDAGKLKEKFLKLTDEEPAESKARWGERITKKRIENYRAHLEEKYKGHFTDEAIRKMNELDELWREVVHEQSKLDIKDEQSRILFESLFGIAGDYNGRVTASRIHASLQKFADSFKDGLDNMLPNRSIMEVDLAPLDEEIRFFAEYFKAKNKRKHFHHYNEWPRPLLNALLLEILADKRDYFSEFLHILRSYDSVHLHQAANSLEKQFDDFISLFKMDLWLRYEQGKSQLDLVKESANEARKFFVQEQKKIAQLTSAEEFHAIEQDISDQKNEKLVAFLERFYQTGPHKVTAILQAVRANSFSEILKDFREVEQAFADVFTRHPAIRSQYDASYAKTLLEAKVIGDREVITQADREIMWKAMQDFGHLTKRYLRDEIFFEAATLDDTKRKQEAVNFMAFYQKEIIDSGLYAEMVAALAELDKATEKAQAFITKYKIEFYEGYDRKKDTNQVIESIRKGHLYDLEKETYARFARSVHDIMHFNSNDRNLKMMNADIFYTQAAALFGNMIKKQGFSQVVFNETGEVDVKEMFSMFKEKAEQILNDAHFGDNEFARLIAAANMSGKTFFLKALTMLMLSALNTGFAPATFATLPLFHHVIYLDRVTEKLDQNLSGLGNEVEMWKKFFEVLKSNLSVFVAAYVDEAFSTTSPKYQSSLVYAIVMELVKKGQYLAIASHNHDVLRILRELENGLVAAYTMKIKIGEEGKVTFDYKVEPLREGELTFSEAIPVARTMHFNEEILGYAQQAKDALIQKAEPGASAGFGTIEAAAPPQPAVERFQKLELIEILNAYSQRPLRTALVKDSASGEKFIFRFLGPGFIAPPDPIIPDDDENLDSPEHELSYAEIRLENELSILQKINGDGSRKDIPRPITGMLHWQAEGNGIGAVFQQTENGDGLKGFLIPYYPGLSGYSVQFLQSSKAEIAEVSQILLKSAEALAYVHSRGFVHRDVDPGNYMLNEDNGTISTILIDFEGATEQGADIVERPEFHLLTEHFSETFYWDMLDEEELAEFMIGEEETEDDKLFDTSPSYDIFSWGATAFYWITELKPSQIDFSGRDIADIETPADWYHFWKEALGKSVFAPIVLKAMNLDPNQRYKSMERVIFDLKKLRKRLHLDTGFGVVESADLYDQIIDFHRAQREKFKIAYAKAHPPERAALNAYEDGERAQRLENTVAQLFDEKIVHSSADDHFQIAAMESDPGPKTYYDAFYWSLIGDYLLGWYAGVILDRLKTGFDLSDESLDPEVLLNKIIGYLTPAHSDNVIEEAYALAEAHLPKDFDPYRNRGVYARGLLKGLSKMFAEADARAVRILLQRHGASRELLSEVLQMFELHRDFLIERSTFLMRLDTQQNYGERARSAFTRFEVNVQKALKHGRKPPYLAPAGFGVAEPAEPSALIVNGKKLEIVPMTSQLVQSKRRAFFELFKLMSTDIYLSIPEHVDQFAFDNKKMNPEMSFAILNEAGEPIASAALADSTTGVFKPGESVYLRMFTTHPDFQGTGVAARLLYQALTRAKERGYKYAEWLTTLHSERAIRFYEKIGAVRTGKPFIRPQAEIENVPYVVFQAVIDTVLPRLASDFQSKQRPAGFGVTRKTHFDTIKESYNPVEIRNALYKLRKSMEFSPEKIIEAFIARQNEHDKLWRSLMRDRKMVVFVSPLFVVSLGLIVSIVVRAAGLPLIPSIGIFISTVLALFAFGAVEGIDGPRRMTFSKHLSGSWNLLLERFQNLAANVRTLTKQSLYLNEAEMLFDAYFNAKRIFWESFYRWILFILADVTLLVTQVPAAYEAIGPSINRSLLFLGAAAFLLGFLKIMVSSLYEKYLRLDQAWQKYQPFEKLNQEMPAAPDASAALQTLAARKKQTGLKFKSGFGVLAAGIADLFTVSELFVSGVGLFLVAFIFAVFPFAMLSSMKEMIHFLLLRPSIKTLKNSQAPAEKRLAALRRLSLKHWFKPPLRTRKIVVERLTDAEPSIRREAREILFQYFRKKYESPVGSYFDLNVIMQMEQSTKNYGGDLAEYLRPYIETILKDPPRFVKKRKKSYFYRKAIDLFSKPERPEEDRRLAAQAVARMLSLDAHWGWDGKLAEALEDEDVEVRRTAIGALREFLRRRKIAEPSFFSMIDVDGIYEGQSTVDIAGIVRALSDSDAEVRQTATLALANAFTVDYTYNLDDKKILVEIEKGITAGVDIEEYFEPFEDALLYWILEEPFKTTLFNVHYRQGSKANRLRALLHGMNQLRTKYGRANGSKDILDLLNFSSEMDEEFWWEWMWKPVKEAGENGIVGEIMRPIEISTGKPATNKITAPFRLELEFREAFRQSLENTYRAPLTPAVTAGYLYDLKDFSTKMRDARFAEKIQQSVTSLYSPYQIVMLYKVALALTRLGRYDVAGMIQPTRNDKTIRAIAEIRTEAAEHLNNLFSSIGVPDTVPLSRDPRAAGEIFGNFYKGGTYFELRADETVLPWIGEERSMRQLKHALRSDFKNGIRPKGLPVTFHIEFEKSFRVYRKLHWNSFKAGWFKQGVPTLVFMFFVGLTSGLFRQNSVILGSCMFLGVLGTSGMLTLLAVFKLGEKYGWVFKHYRDELINRIVRRNWEQKAIDSFIQKYLPRQSAGPQSVNALDSASAGFGMKNENYRETYEKDRIVFFRRVNEILENEYQAILQGPPSVSENFVDGFTLEGIAVAFDQARKENVAFQKFSFHYEILREIAEFLSVPITRSLKEELEFISVIVQKVTTASGEEERQQIIASLRRFRRRVSADILHRLAQKVEVAETERSRVELFIKEYLSEQLRLVGDLALKFTNHITTAYLEKDFTVVFIGRGTEQLELMLKTVLRKRGQNFDSRIKQIYVSSQILESASNLELRLYLESQGILDNNKVVFVDTGMRGTIARKLAAIARAWGKDAHVYTMLLHQESLQDILAEGIPASAQYTVMPVVTDEVMRATRPADLWAEQNKHFIAVNFFDVELGKEFESVSQMQNGQPVLIPTFTPTYHRISNEMVENWAQVNAGFGVAVSLEQKMLTKRNREIRYFRNKFLRARGNRQDIALKEWLIREPESLAAWLMHGLKETIEHSNDFDFFELPRRPGDRRRDMYSLSSKTVTALLSLDDLVSAAEVRKRMGKTRLRTFKRAFRKIYAMAEWPVAAYPFMDGKIQEKYLALAQVNERSINGFFENAKSLLADVGETNGYFGAEEPNAILENQRSAFLETPRHLFMPRYLKGVAYHDDPKNIGHGQTISQPSLMAFLLMLLNLTPTDNVLEVGAGSGWFAALMSRKANHVHATELIPELAKRAEGTIAKMGIRNVSVIASDGTLGYPQAGPYDAIVVSAGSPHISTTLWNQLAEGGRLVAPVYAGRFKEKEYYQFVLVVKENGKPVVKARPGITLQYVPLLGMYGWTDEVRAKFQAQEKAQAQAEAEARAKERAAAQQAEDKAASADSKTETAAAGFGFKGEKPVAAVDLTFDEIKSEWETAKDGTTLIVTDNHAETERVLFNMPPTMRAAIFRDVKNVMVALPGDSEKAWALAKRIVRLLNIHEENAHGFADYEELAQEENLMLLRRELFQFGKEEHLPPIIRHLRTENNIAIAEWLEWLGKQHSAVQVSA